MSSHLDSPDKLFPTTWRKTAWKVVSDPAVWLAVLVVALLAIPRPPVIGTPTVDLIADLAGIGVAWTGLSLMLGRGTYRVVLRGLGIFIVVLLAALSAPGLNELMELWVAAPGKAVPALLAVTTLAAIEAVFSRRRATFRRVRQPIKPYRQSPEDLRRVAIHEAGHTLLYRLLPECPKEMRVFVRPVINEGTGEANGGGVRLVPMQVSEKQAYAVMLIKLAGLEAEVTLLGSRGNGGVSDYSEWIELATRYATAGSAGAFYRFPVWLWQRQINRDTINALQERQREDLRAFFSGNKDLLLELSDDLLARGELDHEQITAYLNRVDVLPIAYRLPA